MHWIYATIVAGAVLAGSLHTLVLNSGARLAIEPDVRIEEGLVLFRVQAGPLHSIPLSEIDLEGTEKANQGPRSVADPAGPTRTIDQAKMDLERLLADRNLSTRQIVVSDEEKQRLIEEAAKSRGTPSEPAPLTPSAEPSPAPATTSNSKDEWAWRERARTYRDRVTRAREDLQLLIDKEQRLQDEILGLLSLGYNPNQFNLQVLQLAHTRDSIPQAQLNLQRAEREWSRFKDDARRQGVLPGWLR